MGLGMSDGVEEGPMAGVFDGDNIAFGGRGLLPRRLEYRVFDTTGRGEDLRSRVRNRRSYDGSSCRSRQGLGQEGSSRWSTRRRIHAHRESACMGHEKRRAEASKQNTHFDLFG